MVKVYCFRSKKRVLEVLKSYEGDSDVYRIIKFRKNGCYCFKVVFWDDEGERRWFGSYSWVDVVEDECRE